MVGRHPMLIIGMDSEQCKDKLDKITDRITSTNRRYAGVDRVDKWLGDMEKTYSSYRRANPKYNEKLDENQGMSHGVRQYYRECLYRIVLNNNVRNVSKKTAIKLLISDRANKELYDLLRPQQTNDDKESNYRPMIDKELVDLILKHFPEHCDQDLINIANQFAMRAYYEWAEMAIRKIESPRILLAVCTSFRDEKSYLKCVDIAIECLGRKIEESLTDIDQYNKNPKNAGKNINVNNNIAYSSSLRSAWQHEDFKMNHTLSMLYSAHVALATVIVEYGNTWDGRLTAELRDEEKRLYQKALEKIVISGFIDNIFPRISNVDSEKVDYCLARLDELNSGNAVQRSIIANRNLPALMICQAINNIDLDQQENSPIKSMLMDYIVDATLNPLIRKAACEKINHNKHDYQPHKDGDNRPTYLFCTQCGATKELERPGQI